jgi:hypothetical protein
MATCMCVSVCLQSHTGLHATFCQEPRLPAYAHRLKTSTWMTIFNDLETGSCAVDSGSLAARLRWLRLCSMPVCTRGYHIVSRVGSGRCRLLICLTGLKSSGPDAESWGSWESQGPSGGEPTWPGCLPAGACQQVLASRCLPGYRVPGGQGPGRLKVP